MQFIIELQNVASGPFFFASGRRRPDSYRFERVKGSEHLHRLIVPGEKADEFLKDLGLRLQQIDIPVHIRVVIEDKDRDGGELIAEARERLAALKQANDGLIAALEAKPTVAAPEAQPAGQRITDEQLQMLVERDEMLELLMPFAKDEDTPLDVLRRIVDEYKALKEAPAPVPAEQADEPARSNV